MRDAKIGRIYEDHIEWPSEYADGDEFVRGAGAYNMVSLDNGYFYVLHPFNIGLSAAAHAALEALCSEDGE